MLYFTFPQDPEVEVPEDLSDDEVPCENKMEKVENEVRLDS